MAKNKYLIPYLLTACALLTSCAKQAYYIDTHTSRGQDGNYVVQWQINPGMKGHVAIYASQDANFYPEQPNAIEQIEKEIYHYTTPSGTPQHTYFLLVFNDHDMRVVSSRTIPTIGVLNLRDRGGYMTTAGEQMRWGMIYTSGDLWRSFGQDLPAIATLGIRTQYILAPSDIADFAPTLGISDLEQIYVYPDSLIDESDIIKQIYEGKLSIKDVQKLRQSSLENLVLQNPNQIRIVLNELTDPSHYPVLLSDKLGRDGAAFVTLLIHHILGVSRSDAIADYLINNETLPANRLEPNGFTQPTRIQEALTEYFRSQPSQISKLIDRIEKEYGSLSNYITDQLRFDAQKQEQLRALLLY